MLIMASEAGYWYLDTKLWVAIPVILFLVFLAYKGVHKAIFGALDDRATEIRTELDEARRLREEAQALLASFHRKQKEAEQQAEDIVRQARSDAEAMAERARVDLAVRLERREAMAKAKIEAAEAKALAEVKGKAADMAIKTAERLIRTQMKATDHTQFIKDGIRQIGKTLN